MKLLHQRRVRIIAALALCVALVFALTPREPEYQGKKLSAWLAQSTNFITTLDYRDSTDSIRAKIFAYNSNTNLAPRTCEAVLALGTRALPHLWSELNAAETPLRDRLASLIRRVGIHAMDSDPAYLRWQRGWDAIRLLGTNAAPLAPQFATWLSAERPRRAVAGEFFVTIGPAGLPVLHEALRSENRSTRFLAALLIHDSDTNTTVHLPVVVDTILQPIDYSDRRDALLWANVNSSHGYEPLYRALLSSRENADGEVRHLATAGLQRQAVQDPALLPFLQATAAQTNDPVLAKAARDVLETFPDSGTKPTP